MPELPEVETTRRDLDERIRGHTIVAICFGEGVLPVRGRDPVEFASALRGRRFEALSRRGKYLIAHLDGGDALVFHRRMTGNLVLRSRGDSADPYTRAVIRLDNGTELRWTDLRRFGTWELATDPESATPGLGAEPLDDAWSADDLAAVLTRRTAPVKATLLDQRRIAGLGNIYADEALHRAGIHPEREAGTLAPAEVARLHAAIRQVLTRAIELQGSSIRDHVGGYGQRGSMQDEWHVYQRTGEPCLRCGTQVERTRVAGRGTHFCPRCQPRLAGEPVSNHEASGP